MDKNGLNIFQNVEHILQSSVFHWRHEGE